MKISQSIYFILIIIHQNKLLNQLKRSLPFAEPLEKISIQLKETLGKKKE